MFPCFNGFFTLKQGVSHKVSGRNGVPINLACWQTWMKHGLPEICGWILYALRTRSHRSRHRALHVSTRREGGHFLFPFVSFSVPKFIVVWFFFSVLVFFLRLWLFGRVFHDAKFHLHLFCTALGAKLHFYFSHFTCCIKFSEVVFL